MTTATFFAAPSATSTKEEHADWLELRSILDGDQSTSLQDLIRELRRGGTVPEADDGNDWGSESSERIAQDAFSELEARALACGEDRYPFAISNHSIKLSPNFRQSPYTFQLLLTTYGMVKFGKVTPEKIFEDLAAFAAQRYFGPDGQARSLAFGFPRRYEPKNFAQALDDLCIKLGEGGGAVSPDNSVAGIAKKKRLAAQKDGKLDIVAWRPFPDGRVGKLIGFGQCAAGDTDWRTKFSEVQPDAFRELWLRTCLVVKPIRMFFVPRRVEQDIWEEVGIQAGLLFDRCRITHHLVGLPSDIRTECEAWTSHVISAHLRPSFPANFHAKNNRRKRGEL